LLDLAHVDTFTVFDTMSIRILPQTERSRMIGGPKALSYSRSCVSV
jgi:hypothetical protein